MAPFVMPVGSVSRGFSLPEVMVAVAIIGIMLALASDPLLQFQRRERVNAVAMSMVGWLSMVSRAALRLNADSSDGAGCQVSFKSGTVTPGNALLEVDAGTSSECRTLLGAQAVLKLDSVMTNGFSVQLLPSATTLTYTRRAMTTGTAAQSVKLAVGGTRPIRCIDIDSLSGTLRIGRDNTSTSLASAACVYSARGGF
jgi:prepilin-type N-terminal cleavage/methylation domain-containing protein